MNILFKYINMHLNTLNEPIAILLNRTIEMFKHNSRLRKIAYRFSLGILLIGMLMVFIPTSSSAYSSTWNQTQ